MEAQIPADKLSKARPATRWHCRCVSLTLRGAANTLLHAILLLEAELDIDIQASWLSSKSNTLTDALSRHNTNVIAKYLNGTP